MKMGADAPILDRHQARQNIDFFNTIRTKLPFVKANTNTSYLSSADFAFDLTQRQDGWFEPV